MESPTGTSASYAPPPAPPRSGNATTILILGILGLVCCQILGPIAWYMGDKELKSIRAGLVSQKDEGMTKAGMILGIIGTVILGLSVLWIIFFGGIAVIGGLMDSMPHH